MDSIREERYNEYLYDINIAATAIKNALLYPTGKILYDLYAIPSHNHQAYYALVVEKENSYELVYAKTEIKYQCIDEVVRMYSFADAKEADSTSNAVGKIIIGITPLNFYKENLPEPKLTFTQKVHIKYELFFIIFFITLFFIVPTYYSIEDNSNYY